MNKYVFIILTIISLFPAGCTMAPKYTRPQAPVASTWPEGKAYTKSSATPDAVDPLKLSWREFFTDENLQKVLQTALNNNRDLKLAVLNVELARALYGIQKASLFPAFDATGSSGKQRLSGDLTRSGESRSNEQYSINLGVLSWEIDFFGRIRSLKDRALEEYLATEQARRSTQVLLVSSIANTYLALAADKENLILAKNTFQAQKEAYELVDQMYKAGVATELDLRRAQTLIDTARLAVSRYTQLVGQDANSMALLAGTEVSAKLLPAKLADVKLPEKISQGLSSDILLKRPDVLQAENFLKAANADIGAARAAFFPRISLTAVIGTASNELNGLFKSGTDTWNFAPQAIMPVFDARIWAAHRAAKVLQKMAVTQYEKTIQNAFREVADALAVRGTIDEQVSAQTSLVEALSETYRLSNARYKSGLDDYLGVIEAQRSLFSAQQVLINLQLAQFASYVKLYAVLGGGSFDSESKEEKS